MKDLSDDKLGMMSKSWINALHDAKNTSHDEIQLFVRGITDNTIIINLRNNDTFEILENEIRRKIKYLPDSIIFYYESKKISRNNGSLRLNGIKNNGAAHLSIPINGGMSTRTTDVSIKKILRKK